MRKVLTFVLAVMLVMTVPAYAVSSPVATVASATKTAPLPVVAEALPEGVKLIATTALTAESKESVVVAQAELKAAAPAGMAVRYFFYAEVDADTASTIILKLANVQDVVVKLFKDGKWIELKSILNADGTVTIEGIVDGPIAIFTK